MSTDEGRTLPHDLDAERSVLGSILLDNEAIDRVAGWLRAHHFYRKNHEDVYKAALDLRIEGEPIDIITVGNRLDQTGALNRIGGRAALTDFESTVPTAANVTHYGQIVLDKAVLRRTIRFGATTAERGYEATEDVAQVIAEVQRDAFALSEDHITEEAEPIGSMLAAFMEELDRGTAPAPVWSGLRSLDELVGGFIPGQLIVICGRPGMGKSAMTQTISLNAAKAGHGVAIFTLEMSKPELVTRLIAQSTGLECKLLDKARRGLEQLTGTQEEKVMRGVAALTPMPIFIDDQGGITDDILVSKARRVAVTAKSGIGLVVIDYLGLMRSSEDTGGNRVQEVGYITHKLKALAKELKVPVLLAAQLNRSPEMRSDKRPQLSDLRESGDVEQDADVVIGVFRESYYDDSKSPTDAEAIVLKQRAGSTGTCYVHFREETTRFFSRDSHHSQEEVA